MGVQLRPLGHVPVTMCSTLNERVVRTILCVLQSPEMESKMCFLAGDIIQEEQAQPDICNLATSQLNIGLSVSDAALLHIFQRCEMAVQVRPLRQRCQ